MLMEISSFPHQNRIIYLFSSYQNKLHRKCIYFIKAAFSTKIKTDAYNTHRDGHGIHVMRI